MDAAKWLLPSASDGIAVDAELTVGDKSEEVNTEVGTEHNTQTATTINNVQDIPLTWVLLFMLMAGWAIPAPAEMGRGLILFLRTLLPWGKR